MSCLLLHVCLFVLAVFPLPSRSGTRIEEWIVPGSLQGETSLAPGLDPQKEVVEPKLCSNWGSQRLFDLIVGGKGNSLDMEKRKKEVEKSKKKSKKQMLETIYKYNWISRLFTPLLQVANWTGPCLFKTWSRFSCVRADLAYRETFSLVLLIVQRNSSRSWTDSLESSCLYSG